MSVGFPLRVGRKKQNKFPSSLHRLIYEAIFYTCIQQVGMVKLLANDHLVYRSCSTTRHFFSLLNIKHEAGGNKNKNP